MHEKAFGSHYAKRPDGKLFDIGLDVSLLSDRRIVLVGERLEIDGDLTLFSGVTGGRLRPSGNEDLLMKKGDCCVQDDFAHEQNLVLREEGKTVLIAGCAHNGIVNILEKFRAISGRFPDVVLGGFHLYNPGEKKARTAGRLRNRGIPHADQSQVLYLPLHRAEAYGRLRELMGERVEYLSAGAALCLGAAGELLKKN